MADDPSHKRKTYKICSHLPQRYVMAVLLFFGIFICYLMMVSEQITVPHVLVPLEQKEKDSSCGFNKTREKFVPTADEQYNWNIIVRSFLSTGHFWGFLITNIPSGVLSDRYGARNILSCSILAVIFFHILTPKILEKTHGNYFSAIMVKVLKGAAMGFMSPTVNCLISNWVPKRDLGKTSAIPFSASQFAIAFNLLVTDCLVEKTSWSVVYYIYGAVGAAWFLAWYFLGYSRFEQSHLLSEKEYSYLKKEMEDRATLGRKPIPWRQILKSVPLWALVATSCGHCAVWYVLIRILPLYLQEVPRYGIRQSYTISAVPYAVMGCATIAIGVLSDFLINSQRVTTTTTRKTFAAIGGVGPGLLMVISAYLGCAQIQSLVLLALGIALLCGYHGGTKINALDLAPNFSGLIQGIAGAAEAAVGAIVPGVFQLVIKNEELREWQILCWIFFVVLIVTTVPFLILGSGELQEWNRVGGETPGTAGGQGSSAKVS